jgi:hypothetical protein
MINSTLAVLERASSQQRAPQKGIDLPGRTFKQEKYE